MNLITGKIWLKKILVVLALVASPMMMQAEPTPSPKRVLITNISIFNGLDKTLITGKHVVLAGDKIEGLVDATDTSDNYDQVADLLIYGQNPLEDVAIAADPEKHLKFIMKDGKIHKNTL